MKKIDFFCLYSHPPPLFVILAMADFTSPTPALSEYPIGDFTSLPPAILEDPLVSAHGGSWDKAFVLMMKVASFSSAFTDGFEQACRQLREKASDWFKRRMLEYSSHYCFEDSPRNQLERVARNKNPRLRINLMWSGTTEKRYLMIAYDAFTEMISSCEIEEEALSLIGFRNLVMTDVLTKEQKKLVEKIYAL